MAINDPQKVAQVLGRGNGVLEHRYCFFNKIKAVPRVHYCCRMFTANEAFERDPPTVHFWHILPPTMGCGYSKDHPRNADLLKLKKKYDTEPIKKAKLLNIWIIGGNKSRTMNLAKILSDKLDFLFVTEDSLLQTEMEGDTERGKIIKDIVHDKGKICPGVVLDLATERVLQKINDVKGVVFHGIPRNRDQAWHLQRLIGPVHLVVYCELKGDELKSQLASEGDDNSFVKANVDHFQKCVLQLSKHKTTLKVDGSSEPESLLDEIVEKIKILSNKN